MSGIAVAVDWERAEGGTGAVRRMLSAMPHRSPDGASVAAASHAALGMGLRATTARERAAAQPLHDPVAGLWLVADARIDNRDEVSRALDLPAPPASDAELLLRGLAEELLRAANVDLKAGAGERLDLADLGMLRSKVSRRGHASGMAKAGAAGAHWAFYFRPRAALAKRCREICAGRPGA